MKSFKNPDNTKFYPIDSIIISSETTQSNIDFIT